VRGWVLGVLLALLLGSHAAWSSEKAASPAPQGAAEYRVSREGLAVGTARLVWERLTDGRYRIVLQTQSAGVAALLVPFDETRVSEGVIRSGWWIPTRVVRSRPGKADEVIERTNNGVQVTRKGAVIHYVAPEEAQDFLSLLFSLPSRAAEGVTAGETTLLGVKRGKAIRYRLVGDEQTRLANGDEVGTVRFAAETPNGDWQVGVWWQKEPTVRLVRLTVTGEEGAFAYELQR